MAIEEICKALGRLVNEGEELDYDTLVAIERALRAAQKMRSALQSPVYARPKIAGGIFHNGCMAWDAALGEKE